MSSAAAPTQVPDRTSGFRGPRIVYTAVVVFGVMCAASFVLAGFGEQGVRLVIRASARTTAAVFVVVFCTSALRRRYPGPLTRWAMRNRRYLGLSAAVSHGYHLGFILSLYAIGVAEEPSLLTVIGGGWGFVLLFAMGATSTDAAQRRLGNNWRRLHLLGIWSIWIIFAVSYFPAATTSLIAAAASLALVAVLLVRVWPQADPPIAGAQESSSPSPSRVARNSKSVAE